MPNPSCAIFPTHKNRSFIQRNFYSFFDISIKSLQSIVLNFPPQTDGFDEANVLIFFYSKSGFLRDKIEIDDFEIKKDNI